MFNLLEINLTGFFNNTIDWILTPFRNELGIYVWPSIFAAVIAFVYVSTRNIGATLFAILIVFGFFGNVSEIIQTPELRLLSSIIATAGLAGLVMSLFLKRHG